MSKIHLGLGVFVHPEMKYNRCAELLLEQAKQNKSGKRDAGYDDDKTYITPKGIESLIGAGPDQDNLVLNAAHSGDNQFYHCVIYKEHCFLSVSRERFYPVVKSDLI